MEYDDKTLALAKYLEIDPAMINNPYSEYYRVNGRTIKEGKTPEQFKQVADDFRALLDEEMQELVTEAVINGCKQIKVEEKGEEIVRPLSDVAYDKVSEYLEPLAERAKKRTEQLKRIGVKPIKETKEDIYNRLKEDNLYVVNVLYYLVKSSANYNTEYCNSLRRAWLGQPVSDTRKDREVDDGEYLVLTDDEADDWEREGLENLFEDFLHDVPEHIKRFVDVEKYIEEHSGDRGSNLNGYDGTEEEVEFEGETYYIYRNN